MYFYPSTHLKRQIDILRDKMGMDTAPKSFFFIEKLCSILEIFKFSYF